MKRLIPLLLLLALNAGAATNTAVSVAFSDVSAAYTASSAGDTVVIPAGTAIWTTTLTDSKGLNWLGAGIGQTIIDCRKHSGGQFANSLLALNNNNACTVTGITFTEGDGSYDSCALGFSAGWGRVTSCQFTNLHFGVMCDSTFVCVDHSSFGNNFVGSMVYGNGTGCINWNTQYPIAYNSTNYIAFFENNTFTQDSTNPAPACSFTQCGQGGSYVFRHNTCSWSASDFSPAHDWHGDNNDGTRGTLSVQIYGNTYTLSGTAQLDKLCDSRGGQSLIYSNTITSTSSHALSGFIDIREEYPAGTTAPQGGGCTSGTVFDVNTNIFVWANTTNGVAFSATCDQNCSSVSYTNASPVSLLAPVYPHPLDTGGTTNLPPNTPINLTPVNGATGVSLTPTLTASAYSDPQLSFPMNSDWQVLFSGSVVWENANAGVVTSVTVPVALTYATTWTWRVRYENELGLWSSWSTPTTFTTANAPAPPTGVTTNVIITGSSIFQ